jgi:transposase
MEGQMLSKEDFVTIQTLHRKGVYQVDIARQLGIHPRTVRRALGRGSAPAGSRPRRRSKLDPFKAQVDALLADDVWNAQVILRELQVAGYTGGISILRDYVRPKRQLRGGRATMRFETGPGQQLQADWGQIWTEMAGERSKVHFCVHTLGYSRRFHAWPAPREDAEHTYQALIEAFEHFGGVTEDVLFDNQGAVVLEHRPPSAPRFHSRLIDLAGHYGFTPRACRPYRARTKGKTERMVGYVKHHFFVRYRRFESWAHLRQLLEQWLVEEADQRVHGTVREVVADRFAAEQPHLRALPKIRWDTSYHESRLVGWDGYLDVRGNRYAVPDHLCGQRVTVRISLEGDLRVYDAERLVAQYRLRPAEQGWVHDDAFHARLRAQAVDVQTRPLSVYEEVARCSSMPC